LFAPVPWPGKFGGQVVTIFQVNRSVEGVSLCVSV
jgi:hypothetical protein